MSGKTLGLRGFNFMGLLNSESWNFQDQDESFENRIFRRLDTTRLKFR